MTTDGPEKRNWLAVGVSVAALVMIAGFSLFVLRLMDSLEHQSGRLAVLQHNAAALEEVLAANDLLIAYLFPPQPDAPGSAKVIWSPSARKGVVHVSNLSRNPDGEQYRVWMTDGPVTESLGTFEVHGSSGYAILVGMDMTASNQSRFIVTREQRDATVHLPGEVLLAGTPAR